MAKAKKILVAAFLLPILGACASYDLAGVDALEQKGNDFDKALHKEYMTLAYAEAAEDDWSDAVFFANKARSSANGASEAPQVVSERDIEGDDKTLMEGIRTGLVDALIAGRKNKPAVAARAQAMFDCWLQEREENFQPDDILRCHEEFTVAYHELRLKEQVAAAPEPMMAKQAGPFLVFFGFDSDALNKAGLSLIESVAKNELAQDPDATIKVIGHADRSGSKDYNLKLSEQRAISVSIALQLAGAAANVSMEHFGEDRPLKATDDGVREPKNRRVEIMITR